MPKKLHRIRRSQELAGSSPARALNNAVAKQQTHRTPQGNRFFPFVAAFKNRNAPWNAVRTTCRGFDSRLLQSIRRCPRRTCVQKNRNAPTGAVAQSAEHQFSPQLSRRKKRSAPTPQEKPRDRIPAASLAGRPTGKSADPESAHEGSNPSARNFFGGNSQRNRRHTPSNRITAALSTGKSRVTATHTSLRSIEP